MPKTQLEHARRTTPSAVRHRPALERSCPAGDFPFPKSLYAVEDALRFFVADKPDAVDRRLLRRLGNDGPRRHAPQQAGRRPAPVDLVTNNEVVGRRAEGAPRARASGRATPSGSSCGICEYITKPRIEAAITGKTPGRRADQGRLQVHRRVPDGRRLRGERRVLHAHLRGAAARREPTASSRRIAPLLWLRAGSRGRRIDDISDGLGRRRRLRRARRPRPRRAVPQGGRRATTTSRSRSSSPTRTGCSSRSSRELPDHVEPVRLYEAYLRNFEIEAGRGAAVKFTLKDYQADARRRRPASARAGQADLRRRRRGGRRSR